MSEPVSAFDSAKPQNECFCWFFVVLLFVSNQLMGLLEIVANFGSLFEKMKWLSEVFVFLK